MNFNHSQDIPTTVGQSPGYDPKTSKRSSGLFSFFKWFKSSPSRESSVPDLLSSSSSSCDSINSRISTGTAASFSFVPPKSYQSNILEKKSIALGPETDTYKARLKERDKRRERDKNLTLRKKYNLFFNRETLLKPKVEEEEDSSRSLPLMTRKKMLENSDDETSRLHRRTNSESSKLKKAGAYCHVKGKRKAPQPPTNNKTRDSTLSLRRKKKLAPQPPTVSSGKIISALERLDTIEYADANVISNDSLKLDHGVLKPVTEHTSAASIYSTDSASSVKSEKPMEISPVSPRPWYKRNVNRESTFVPKKEPFKIDNKYEPIQRVPESVNVSNNIEENKSLKNDEITRSIKIFGTNQSSKDDFKRKSGMTFLTNISELDREATEMIKKEQCQSGELDPPPFMRPKQEEAKNTDSWVSPKRKSAKDLIAKFNAITNVTKVTVNSTFFGSKEPGGAQKDNFKRDYFGRQLSVKDELLHQNKNNKKLSDKYFGKIDQDEKKLIENNKTGIPLMKSESAVIITTNKSDKKETPKTEHKSWNCPKCSIENDYWRIICHVCSTIKPYFDDLSIPSPKNNSLEKNKIENLEVRHFPASGSTYNSKYTPFKSGNDTPHFERSKTQIGFSALSKINHNKNKENKFSKSVSVDEQGAANTAEDNKREERERLKKVLIEMKNSLPKKKNNVGKQNFRSSIIQEKAENLYEDPKKTDNKELNLQPHENSSISTKLPVKVEDKKVTSTPSAAEAKILKNDLALSANSNSNIIAKVTEDNALPQEKSAGIRIKLETKENTPIKIHELTQKQSVVQTDKKDQLVLNEAKKQNLSNDNRALNKTTQETEPLKEKVAEAFIKTTETIYENIKVRKADNLKPTKVSSAVQTNAVLRKFSPENTLDAAKDVKKNPTYELLRPNDFANIYNEKMDSRDENHIYANLIQNGSLFLNMPVNFEDIRNNVANNTDTLEIGRLLKRLELAIAKGELGEAANYARELAQLKVNCSVIRQKSEEEKATARAEDKGFTIHMYVEDKISHRGPFPIKVKGSTKVSQLKLRVERDFEIPINVQKWIIGKQLASDDNATMNELNIYDEGSPLFLYLVAPQKNGK
ncbi:titin homolog [Agrilus planipennis]|uniref:Titin homolog n=1 Tax=Agrilus planipennis TaxID=224129 RepID=A0A1W4XQM5_AGRPL|nr:titin homolog [Agrilus planipennis]